ncbi:MAG: TonB-dependent receptor, partial [Gammaproteobacteria bacterium]|nr:TonB-dependent receptor [Gammaproteobacteria bacterium]
ATLQSDWAWQQNDRVLLRFGGNINRSRAHYDYRDQVTFDVLFADPGAATATTRTRNVLVDPSGHHYGLYASLRYSPTPRLATDFGLRWDKQTLDPAHSSTLSPRIGLRYRLAERTYLRGSLGRFYQSQAVNELQVEDGVDRFFEPQQSDHFVLGIEHAFPEGLSLRIEAYEKRMRRLRPRFENLLNTLALLPELKPDRIRISPNQAQARGFEILLSQQLSYPLTWWLGYSHAWVKDTIAGEKVFRSWDQTHALSAGLNWDTPTWNVGLGLIARSGWPTTPVTLDASGPVPVAVPGGRNSGRVGYYRSADLRLTRKFELERGSLDVFIEINNLLGRENPCCLEYEILEEDEGGGLELQMLDYLPMIPSIGFIWRF